MLADLRDGALFALRKLQNGVRKKPKERNSYFSESL